MTARCPICRKTSYLTDASLLGHVAQHSPRVLAEELLKAAEATADALARATSAEQCGKVSYSSEGAATRALLSTWGDANPRRGEIRAYSCDRCRGRWHLTSKPLREVAT